ncbi:hypothetical protein [Candidatus Epulonipiscium viviparus]|uniref:hypothetical protein n=1 Tax=Candidatus Epulonipiscium viviparus TaxID=420336 RepID=UPI00016BFB5E|nr:hypothetical protein [Candidatus Epulopiscium viviparus]
MATDVDYKNTIPQPTSAIAFIPANPEVMYAMGDRLAHAGEMPFVVEVATDPKNEDRMLVSVGAAKILDGLNCGLYYSEDAGKTFEKVNTGIGPSSKISHICFDPIEEDTLWAASCATGFFKDTIH